MLHHENLYLKDITELQHTIETLVCLIMNIHSTQFYISSIETFVKERRKIRLEQQFIANHINEILPDASKKLPKRRSISEILMYLDVDSENIQK